MKLAVINESVNYLSYENIRQMLPTRYTKALQKAYEWQPKLETQRLNADQQAELVLVGKKPLSYGHNERVLSELSNKYGLDSDYYSLFLPDNRDLAELITFTVGRFEIRSPVRHFIIGLCCGYPVESVEKFSSQYLRPDDNLAQGLSGHDMGNTIR